LSRNATPAAALASTPDELEARFYEALQRGDIDLLMLLWGDDDEVMCVHPGGPRVVGLNAIRASFTAIFANGGIPVQPEQVHRLNWLGGAVHHLVERITVNTDQGEQTAWVLSTNVFVKGPQGWRLVAHHASPAALTAPLASMPAALGGELPSTLH